MLYVINHPAQVMELIMYSREKILAEKNAVVEITPE